MACPEGCANCYEGNAYLNLTSYLIFDRPKLSPNQAINYERVFSVTLICTSC